MYEPIRTKSVVHRVGGHHSDSHSGYPHSSRAEALDMQLAGHLAALLAVTDELGLDGAAARIAAQVARLRGSDPARADTTVAILAAERMDAHAAALASRDLAGSL